MRDIVLVLHIALVACWFGTTVTQIVLTPWFAKRGSQTMISWVEATRLLGKRYDNVAAARLRSRTMAAAVIDVALLLVTMLAMVKRWHA